MRTRKIHLLIAFFLLASLSLCAQTAEANHGLAGLVVEPSPSPLWEVRVMVHAGSASDPAGKEGTASLVANMLIEGGFGDPQNPVTKEKLAEITRPWGSAALPSVLVDKQTTTFTMRVPRDSFPEFLEKVFQPMFNQPLWKADELERLRKEALVGIESGLRFEQQEQLGLLALDNYVFLGTPLGHLAEGTVEGLKAITRDDLASFYQRYYRRAEMYVATSIGDKQAVDQMVAALPSGSGSVPRDDFAIPTRAIQGRHLLIITQPNAIATGLHLGFPIDVTRGDPDYWPLFVGNVFLGTHRDSFGRLYNLIREQRGYNYGDYSYVEYLAGRPFYLFPPPTTPRSRQYFSIWIRPVAHQYTHFILKVMTAELERFVREGLTPEQVAEAKVKARTLYLNYAESVSRRLGYRLDDLFYGMRDRGYIDTMLKSIDAVTAEQVNAAIKKHLQSENLKYIIVTNQSEAAKLADDIANDRDVNNKSLEEYHISEPVPPEKQEMLAQDEQWKKYPLHIERERIRIVPAAQMFETTAIPGISAKGEGK